LGPVLNAVQFRRLSEFSDHFKILRASQSCTGRPECLMELKIYESVPPPIKLNDILFNAPQLSRCEVLVLAHSGGEMALGSRTRWHKHSQ
jgi:hypothetical protein